MTPADRVWYDDYTLSATPVKEPMATSVDHRWKYNTRSASPVKMMADEKPGHKWGYTVRTDTFVPRGGLRQYKPRCSCKWSIEAWLPFKMARAKWLAHMGEVDKQGQLCE